MSFIRTGLREIGLKIRRQRTRMILRHEKRLLQKSEIVLGREGTSQAANFPELRNEIVALKKLEQEQKEVALRIAQIEEGIKKIEAQREANAKEQTEAMAKLEAEKKPILQRRNDAKGAAELCEREVSAVERRIHDNDTADQELLRRLSELQALTPPPADLETQTGSISARRARLPGQRAELVRARLGSSDASRIAKEHLAAVDRHQQHNDELALLSRNIDKQELRQFYFSVVSVIALLAIILPLIAKSPRKREWLPQQTEAILSINTEQFERDDFPKRWQKEQADVWQNVWNGLIGPAARVPALNLSRDTLRITRAATSSDIGTVREFILIENRGDVSQIIRSVQGDKEFHKRDVSGLPVWEKPDLALARVGPSTLAVGSSSEVDELVRVRLGIDLDLKITGQLFDRFQALDSESALRMISRSPPDLTRMFHPIFVPELLENSQLLGLALTLQNPVKARLFLKLKSPESASELARNLHNEPQRWLRLQDSNLLLYAQPPEITRQGANLELHFNVAEETARLLLQRIAKTDIATSVAGD